MRTVARFAKRLEAVPLGRKDSNSKRKSRNAREKRDGSSGTNVDAEKFAKELGVLKPWEKVGE